jgi:hypothetical protein
MAIVLDVNSRLSQPMTSPPRGSSVRDAFPILVMPEPDARAIREASQANATKRPAARSCCGTNDPDGAAEFALFGSAHA